MAPIVEYILSQIATIKMYEMHVLTRFICIVHQLSEYLTSHEAKSIILTIRFDDQP